MAKGVVLGEDFVVFSQDLNISLQELKVIMGWESDEDAIYDCQLETDQAASIERVSALSFPKGLDYYLTCYQ
ncbi:DUF7683 domain-containing protein [Pseudomonas sp. 3A(2025)]